MTKEQLDEWFSKFHISSHCSGHGDSSDHIGFLGWEAKPHLEKLLNLAQYGMWALETGIPALTVIATNQCPCLADDCSCGQKLENIAKAALPEKK